MGRFTSGRRFAAVFTAATAAALVFAGPSTAAPAAPLAPQSVDWTDAVAKLKVAAAGNTEATAALNRLTVGPKQAAALKDVALPFQPFQVPAYSDVGAGGNSGQLYGSGVALDLDGFRFGFFGGKGTISPNQNGAVLSVIWYNLQSGANGTEILNQHNDIPVDTTIRSRVVNTGSGLIVAAVYGSAWHRWPVPVDDAHKDGFAYEKSNIFFPSLGSVLG